MNQQTNISHSNASLDPQDIAEAYRTFRRARLILFCFLMIGLIVVQSLFWIVESGGIDALLNSGKAVFVNERSNGESMIFTQYDRERLIDNGGTFTLFREVAEEPDKGLKSAEAINTFIREGLPVTNYVLFLSAILYCLMLFVAVHLTLVGRMGGVTAAGKAFFLSLVALILLMPWQLIVGIFPGTLYTYSELIERYQEHQGASLGDWDSICYYFRFSGLWLITMVFLILAQLKSSKSKKQIQERLKPKAVIPESMGAPIEASPPTIAVSDIGDAK